MCEVTLDALESAGFKAFGWVHAATAERENVKRITANGETYEHGGFVYEMKHTPAEFWRMRPHTEDQIREFKLEDERARADDEVVPTDLMGRLRFWWARYKRDRAQSREESAMMRKLTQSGVDVRSWGLDLTTSGSTRRLAVPCLLSRSPRGRWLETRLRRSRRKTAGPA